MASRDTRLYLGHLLKDITTGEMVHLFVIVLWGSMSSYKMGSYQSYFRARPNIHLGAGYCYEIRGFDPWARDVMSLIRFKKTWLAYHP
eukprot:15338008-Ditylum_brightwellii.AAC.1